VTVLGLIALTLLGGVLLWLILQPPSGPGGALLTNAANAGTVAAAAIVLRVAGFRLMRSPA
jgi:hypothetical protein